MDWSNERFVRLYTRDTVTWKLLDWRARTVLMHMFRKVDRAGVLDVGDDGVCGLAAIVELPLEIVEPGIAQLVARRGKAEPTVLETPNAYVIPRFLEAQETPQSDRRRQEESRARRRDKAMAESRLPAELSRSVTDHRDSVTPNVTRGHATSHGVTPSDPSDPSEDLPPARDPAVPSPRPEQTQCSSPPPPPPPSVSLESLWGELESARREVAEFHAVEYRPLVAHDRGRHELADALALAARAGKRDETVEQVRHAIAVASAEARADRDRVKWLTGAIFSPDNFRRLVAEDIEQAGRPRAGPRGSAGRAPESIRKIKTL